MADLWAQSNKKPQEASGKYVPLKTERLTKNDVLTWH